MAARRTTRGTRLSGDEGSAIVEAAIVLPVVVLLIFGIVEIGFLFRSATIVSTSSRNGARLASAQYGSQKTLANQNSLMDNVRLTVEKDLTSRAGVDTPVVLWIYKADANGNPPSGNFSSCGSPCYVYTWNAGTGHFTYSSGTWTTAVACGVTHDAVGVFVRVTHKPVGFTSAFGTFTISEDTVMRLEPDTTSSCKSGT